MANGVSADRVNKIYEVACDGRSHLPGLLRRLNTVERKIELQTKHRESDRNTTPLITAAVRGNQNSVKTLLTYKADTEGRGTIKVDDHVVKACTPLWAAAAAGHLDVVQLLRAGTKSRSRLKGRKRHRLLLGLLFVMDELILKIFWSRTEQILTQGRMMRVHRCFQLAAMITQILWNVF